MAYSEGIASGVGGLVHFHSQQADFGLRSIIRGSVTGRFTIRIYKLPI